MLDALLDLVLPRSCAGCSDPGRALCPRCLALLTDAVGRPTRPTPCPPGLPPLATATSYDGAVRRLLVAHKDRGQLALARPLGLALAAAVHSLAVGGLYGPLLLCPVPSDPAAVRARGHDHALRLAASAARCLSADGVPARVARLLRPARSVADQSGLTSAGRAENLHGALSAVAGSVGPVVVVDDIVTTGATLVEATRALRAAGHRVAGAAVVAATARRGSSPGRVPGLS